MDLFRLTWLFWAGGHFLMFLSLLALLLDDTLGAQLEWVGVVIIIIGAIVTIVGIVIVLIGVVLYLIRHIQAKR